MENFGHEATAATEGTEGAECRFQQEEGHSGNRLKQNRERIARRWRPGSYLFKIEARAPAAKRRKKKPSHRLTEEDAPVLQSKSTFPKVTNFTRAWPTQLQKPKSRHT